MSERGASPQWVTEGEFALSKGFLKKKPEDQIIKIKLKMSKSQDTIGKVEIYLDDLNSNSAVRAYPIPELEGATLNIQCWVSEFREGSPLPPKKLKKKVR